MVRLRVLHDPGELPVDMGKGIYVLPIENKFPHIHLHFRSRQLDLRRGAQLDDTVS